MPAINKILFPVDFSAQCDYAAPLVKSFADATGARITLFHALDAAHYVFAAGEFAAYGWNEFFQTRKEMTAKQLDEYHPDLFGKPGTERVLQEGEAGRHIVAYANENNVDLIMMPSHGLGPFRRFLIGSVTAKVLHDARCPVFTGVHTDSDPRLAPSSWKNIVCAVDTGQESDAALRWATNLATLTGGKVTIAHAYPIVEARPQKYMDLEFEAALAEQAREAIAQLQKRVGTSCEVLVRGGNPENVVREIALDHNADLVVIARGSAAGGFGRLLSHAYSIIRNSPCPVVSV